MKPATELPAPAADALALSARLADRVRTEIRDAGGVISFARYMELCLYTPGLGYYSAGQRKFGPDGDFVTAPELGDLFARCLARAVAAVLAATDGGDILELGAGSGRLAVDLLGELEALAALPRRYRILERSADLRQRQQALVRERLPHLQDRVHWLERLPEPGFTGVMLGNEVLDAMAVERFHWDGREALQVCVAEQGEGFDWVARSFAARPGGEQATRLALEWQLPAPYTTELNAGLHGWLSALAGPLARGLMLFIDYGYPRREYYHEQRSSGTLQCHYRQRVHGDPFLWPGLQDITAHVDFTAVAEAAVSAGLAVSGYTTQAQFLLDCGIDELLQAHDPVAGLDYLRQAQQAKTLLLPGEMGERFQCIGLTRDLDIDLPGFRRQDQRHRL
jgi:SAM-dependent MidA family methyltransferase